MVRDLAWKLDKILRSPMVDDFLSFAAENTWESLVCLRMTRLIKICMYMPNIPQWAGVAYHKRSWLSTALCSKSDGLIWLDRDSVQSIQYGKWMISAHCFAWFRLGQFYYYDSTQKLKVSKHD